MNTNTTFAIALTAALVSCNAAKAETPVKNIAGQVGNINHTTSSMGMTFRVQFSNIRYNGNVQNVEVIDLSGDVATVRVAMKNVNLTINRTNVVGSRQQASCGPLLMRFGTTRELVVDFKVRNSKDKLQLVDSKFRLESDNVQVGSPQWVRAKGFGMTQSRVTSGIRSGLSNNVRKLEQCLVAELPNIFNQIQDEVATNLAANEVPSLNQVAAR